MNTPRILLCGASSGSGKTTITCGLLQALVNRGLRTAAFKCGPDYIDPMFHSTVIGAKSRNLDSFFAPADTLRYLLQQNAAGCDISVIEGVMGYYDGIATTSQASSHQVAAETQTPAVLIVNVAGMSLSAAAIVSGFCKFKPQSGIRGVILNQAPPSLYPELKKTIEEACGVRVYGYFPKAKDLVIESRHLGLVRPHEVENLRQKLHALAEKLEQTVEIDALLELARTAPPLTATGPEVVCGSPVTIAVAKDEAFCFYYEDNLQLLQRLGARLVPFSPLRDAALPEGVHGLWLGGGYPELYGQQLADNVSMRDSIREAIAAGLPCIAECGGFMYLHRSLRDLEQRVYPMCGVLDAEVYYTGKLRRFGYVNLQMLQNTPLGAAGTTLRGHEFHYFDTDSSAQALQATKPVRGTNWTCATATDSLLCGFPHYYLYSNPDCAAHFVDCCRRYEKAVQA